MVIVDVRNLASIQAVDSPFFLDIVWTLFLYNRVAYYIIPILIFSEDFYVLDDLYLWNSYKINNTNPAIFWHSR